MKPFCCAALTLEEESKTLVNMANAAAFAAFFMEENSIIFISDGFDRSVRENPCTISRNNSQSQTYKNDPCSVGSVCVPSSAAC
jgi:hypothetical protein